MLNNERLEKLPLMDLVHGLVRDRKKDRKSAYPRRNKQLLNLPHDFDDALDPPHRKRAKPASAIRKVRTAAWSKLGRS